ncbi:hypothetical protein [Halobellus ordinarius]|uniref:hypothetical protein n=1 Tax=Halobellus ordinarius TaxID=3075120 RepID=UPI0028805784|nr:hypothetical protein [Halobellus sp. ZY16]
MIDDHAEIELPVRSEKGVTVRGLSIARSRSERELDGPTSTTTATRIPGCSPATAAAVTEVA